MLKFDNETFNEFKSTVAISLEMDLEPTQIDYVARCVDALFEKYVYLECELIFPSMEVYYSWIKSKTISLAPFLNMMSNGILELSDSKDISRNINTTINGANELQPLNADITMITSPTTKSKGVTNGIESVRESSPYEARENYKLQLENRMVNMLKHEFMPMFDFYSKIY